MTYIFRGKVIGSDQWVYGNLLNRVDSLGPLSLIEVQDKEPPFEIKTFHVYPESVGMATPRTDKKGTVIYAGDIIDKGRGEIYWDEQHCQFRVRWHSDLYKRIRGGNEPLFSNSRIVWEVIGNATDNPEVVNPASGNTGINNMFIDPNEQKQQEEATAEQAAGQDVQATEQAAQDVQATEQAAQEKALESAEEGGSEG